MTMGGSDGRSGLGIEFRHIVDALPELVWTIHADGSSDFVNRSWCEYTGQAFEQAVGRGWHAAIHSDDLAGFLTGWDAIARLEASGEIAARLRREDGEYRWYALRFAPLPAAGAVGRWCVSATWSDALAQLSEGQRLSKTGTFTSDIQLDQNSGSDEFFRILETDPDNRPSIELIRDRVHADDLDLFDRQMRHCTEDSDADFTFRIVAPQGGLKYLRGVIRVIGHVDGRPIYMGTVQDVTEAKRAEETLRASERDLRSVIDTIPCLAWSARADGWADFLNKRWLDYAGVTAEQAMGHGWFSALHPDDVEGMALAWNEALVTGIGGEVAARLRRFDGVYRWFLFRSNSQRDETGKIVKWYGTPIDIDDLKQAEALLAGEVRLLEMVARGKPLPEVLDGLCRLVEALVPGSACSILTVDADRTHFGAAIGPSLPQEYIRIVSGRIIEGGDGPCSLAALEKTPILTADLASDPRWAKSIWPSLMLAHDYASCWSTPITSVSGDVSGIFAIYRREPVSPTSTVQDLVNRLANIASIAIERAEADEALQRGETELRQTLAQLTEGQRLSKTATFTLDIQLDQNNWSDELFRICEIDRCDHPSIELIRNRIHPEDLDLFDREMRCVAEGNDADFTFRILAPRDGLKYLRSVTRVIEHVDGRPIHLGTVQDITEARRADETLRASERALRGVINSIPCPAWSARADGWADFLNSRWLEYTGFTAEQAQGHGWIAAVHPDDRKALWDAWQEGMARGVCDELAARMRRFDGTYRQFLFRTDSLRDETGRVVKWYGANIDVEDLKHAEVLLAGEVRILEMVARGEPLLEVLDALCRLVEALVPGRFCSILTVGPDRAHFDAAVGPSMPDEYIRLLRGRAIDVGDGPCPLAVFEKTTIVTSDLINDPRWSQSVWPSLMNTHGYASCSSMPIKSVSGEVSGIFAIYRRELASPMPEVRQLVDRLTNIASIAIDKAQADEALRKGEMELRETLARLSQAQRLSKTGCFTWDVLADQHNWSDEVYRIFGYDLGTTVTMQMTTSMVHPDDQPDIARLIAGALDGHDFDLTFRLVTPAGEIRHAHVVAHRQEHIVDRPVFLGAVQDVTEIKAAEEALTQARAELAHVSRITALSALTASIAHEVSQPLTGILTNASTCLRMLAADPPDLVGAATTAERTIRDTNRATAVIKHLRALFARKPPTVEPVDLSDIAREVITLSSNELRRGRVVVQTDFAENLPMVSGDWVQLQQVVVNLLLNAVDAMGEVEDRPRTLLVQTRPEEPGGVTLSVRDSGVGVDAKTIDKLFSAFFTTKAHGMGVGLSISRSIVEGHDGRLWAMPNEDGPGATFFCWIPRAPESVVAIRQGE
jgi:PAS domain S-box-containing protein